jgi:hypothetical protein
LLRQAGIFLRSVILLDSDSQDDSSGGVGAPDLCSEVATPDERVGVDR